MTERCGNGHLRTAENTRYEEGHPVCKDCRKEQYQKSKGRIMKPTIPFSEPDEGPQAKKVITPLGAAIVEALPDRTKVKRIKARFKKGICPSSAIFNPRQVVEFYANCNMKIVAELPS